MQLTFTNKLAIFSVAIVATFGVAFSASAASYKALEIEIDIYDNGSIADVSYEEDGDVVTDTYSYDETDKTVVVEKLAEDLDLTVAEVEASSTVSVKKGDLPVDDSEDEDEDDDADFCDKTSKAAGWGVAKKCVDDENYSLNDKMVKKVERFEDKNMEKYKEFGKTTDQAELQSQLRELLLLLIQLLQKQMLLQGSN